MIEDKIKILLIIENKIQGEFIEMVFEDDPKYTFQKLFNGKEAFELLNDNTSEFLPYVIIMSYQLADMNGIEVMQQLTDNGLSYAFIFLTSDKTVERALEAMKAGAVDFIPKSDNLAEKLQPMVDKVFFIQKDKLEQDRIKAELEENRRELEKLSIVARETDNGVAIFDKNGKLEWMNEGYLKLIGFTKEEFIEKFGDNLLLVSKNENIKNQVAECIKKLISQTYTSQMDTKDGGTIWLQTKLNPVLDEEGKLLKLVSVDSDISDIKRAEAIIRKHTENIENSIHYAKRIQDALLLSKSIIQSEKIFDDILVFLKPHSIVSGDFYWFSKVGDKIIIAAADCTGHGVPGAFMSMLGISSLNVITRQLYMQGEDKLKADIILNQLKTEVIRSLGQKGESGEAQDGMDIALCIIDPDKKIIEFAGAYNPLYLIRNNELQVIDGDKMPIGIHRKAQGGFSSKIIEINNNDVIYLFSDGYVDQFGGENGTKFMKKNFKNLLIDIHNEPMDKQYKILDDNINKWKGNTPQTDDMLIIGLKFKINLT